MILCPNLQSEDMHVEVSIHEIETLVLLLKDCLFSWQRRKHGSQTEKAEAALTFNSFTFDGISIFVCNKSAKETLFNAYS